MPLLKRSYIVRVCKEYTGYALLEVEAGGQNVQIRIISIMELLTLYFNEDKQLTRVMGHVHICLILDMLGWLALGLLGRPGSDGSLM